MKIALRGAFDFDRPLAPEHKDYLRRYGHVRHVARDLEATAQIPDPIRENAKLPLGEQCAYFVGDAPFPTPDANSSPPGTPSEWCPWSPNISGTSLEGDLRAVQADPVAWLDYFIKHFFKRWKYRITGRVSYRRESASDTGLYTIWANQNRIAVAEKGKEDDFYEPNDHDYERAQKLIDAGYLQTSGKYRSLARLPPGKTGIEALEDLDPRAAAQVRDTWERHARSHYLRHPEHPDELKAILSPSEFRAFKRLGGSSD